MQSIPLFDIKIVYITRVHANGATLVYIRICTVCFLFDLGNYYADFNESNGIGIGIIQLYCTRMYMIQSPILNEERVEVQDNGWCDWNALLWETFQHD